MDLQPTALKKGKQQVESVGQKGVGATTSSVAQTPESTSSLKYISEQIKKLLGDALHKKPNATVAIVKEGEQWRADVEVVEEEYLPGQNLKSMNDLLGLYDVTMDKNGQLIQWTKKKMYKRSQGL
jgi:hypothetical protein